jgi:hypothetical protein
MGDHLRCQRLIRKSTKSEGEDQISEEVNEMRMKGFMTLLRAALRLTLGGSRRRLEVGGSPEAGDELRAAYRGRSTHLR